MGVTIFPNPVARAEKLNITATHKPLETIDIYSIGGKRIVTISSIGKYSIQIPITNLTKGIYLLKVTTVAEQTHFRFVKD